MVPGTLTRRLRPSGLLVVAVLAACRSTREAGDTIVVVHFGDSTCITEYLPKADRVDVLLNRRLAEHYPGERIVSHNVCQAGDFVRRFLDRRRMLGVLPVRSRYQRDVRDAIPHIDVALVRYGQNDKKRFPPAEFKRHVEELCDRLLADYPGVHLVLETNGYMDLAHGGHQRDNDSDNLYGDVIRQVARERGYPLVDHYERRTREVAAGNWDLYIRSQKLSRERFGRLIVDGTKDREMEGEPRWFGNRHPSPNGVRLAAEEEFRTLVAAWPDRLPRAAER